VWGAGEATQRDGVGLGLEAGRLPDGAARSALSRRAFRSPSAATDDNGIPIAGGCTLMQQQDHHDRVAFPSKERAI
jgi:hypothetical protein